MSQPTIITKAIATIDDMTDKLRSASDCLTNNPNISQPYHDQIQQWINTANSTIMLTNNNIREMDNMPTPTANGSNYTKVKLSYETTIANYSAIEKEVRRKLHLKVITGDNGPAEFVDGSVDSHCINMPDAPPPTYSAAMGEYAPSAPQLSAAAQPTNPGIYPKQTNVVYLAGPPNIQPVPFPTRKRSACTGCKIALYVLLIILKIIIIVVIVNRRSYSYTLPTAPTLPNNEPDIDQILKNWKSGMENTQNNFPNFGNDDNDHTYIQQQIANWENSDTKFHDFPNTDFKLPSVEDDN